MREMIVSFIDIGGIVDHHCVNFLFIIGKKKKRKKTCTYISIVMIVYFFSVSLKILKQVLQNFFLKIKIKNILKP